MIAKQDKDGNWYVYRRTSSNTRGRRNKFPRNRQATFRNWFLVKWCGDSAVITYFEKKSNLYCPKQFLGKRVRLKVEIME